MYKIEFYFWKNSLKDHKKELIDAHTSNVHIDNRQNTRIENELNLLRVGGARFMRIN